MAEAFERQAIGVFELDSYLSCFVALDAAAKAANVKIQGIERNRLKSGACVKMRGSVSDVTAAVEAAARRANEISGVITTYIIPRPEADTEKMLKLSGMDKTR